MEKTIRIIRGERPADLNAYCMREIAEKEHRLNKRSIILVPETIKAEFEKTFIEKYHGTGLFKSDVLSFRRYAQKMMGETEKVLSGGRKQLSPEAKAILSEIIIRENKDKLAYFKTNGNGHGLGAELSDIIAELMRYDLDADALEIAAAKGEKSSINDKLLDIAFISRKLDEESQAKGFDISISELRRFKEYLDAIKNIKNTFGSFENDIDEMAASDIYICGFAQTRDFTFEEYELIDQLYHYCASLTVCIATDKIENFNSHAMKVYLNLKNSYPCSLQEIDSTHHKKNIFKAIKNAASGLAQKTEENFESKEIQDALSMISFSDVKSEAEFIAGEIKRLKKEENVSYDEIGLLNYNDELYAAYLDKTLADFGIESGESKMDDISDTAVFVMVKSILRMINKKASINELIELLRYLYKEERDNIDELALFLQAAGIDSVNKFYSDYYYERAAKFKDNAYLQKKYVENNFRELKEKCDEIALTAKKTNKKQALLQLSELLNGEENSVFSRTKEMIDELIAANEKSKAASLKTAWDTCGKIIKDCLKIIEGKNIDSETLFEAIISAMSSIKGKAIPAGIERLRRGSEEDIINFKVKYLFIAGALSNRFPSPPVDEGFLSSNERKYLADLIDVNLPDRGDDAAEAASFIRKSLMILPEEKLYITAPVQNDEAISAIMQSIKERYREAFYRIKHENILNQSLLDCENLTRKIKILNEMPSVKIIAAPAEAVVNLSQNKADWQEAYKKISCEGTTAAIENELQLRSDEEAKRQKESLKNRIIIPRKLLKSSISCSRLETFNTCRFRHYALYLLRLREKEVFDPKPDLRGSFMHAIMEAAINDLIAIKNNLYGESHILTAEETKQIIDAWTDNFYIDAKGTFLKTYVDDLIEKDKLRTTARIKEIYRKPSNKYSQGLQIKKALYEKLQATAYDLKLSSSLPVKTEWVFPDEAAAKINLTYKGEKYNLRGIVDRIDIKSNGTYEIFDYKSSDKSFDLNAALAGLQLQPLIYSAAWAAEHPESKVIDFNYYKLGKHSEKQRNYFKAEAKNISDNAKKSSLSENIAKDLKLKKDPRSAEILDLVKERLLTYGLQKAEESLKEISNGYIKAEVRSVKSEDEILRGDVACKYCAYKAVCGIDPQDRSVVKREEYDLNAIADKLGINESYLRGEI